MKKYLHFQIFTVLLISAICISIISALFTFWSTHERVLKSFHSISLDLLETVSETAAVSCYLGQESMMQDVIRGLSKNRIVAGVSLMNSDGILVQIGAASHKFIEDKKYTIRYPLLPLFKTGSLNEPEKIGELTLIQNGELIEQRAKEAAKRDVFAMIQVTFITTFLASALVYFLFTRPIKSIATVLHNTKAGSHALLDYPIHHRTNEIGSLIFDINNLLKKNADALTAERSLRKRLFFLENRYRMIFEQANCAILLANEDGKALLYNPFFTKLAKETGKEQEILEDITQLFLNSEKAELLIKDAVNRKQASSADLLIMTKELDHIWVHALFINCEDDDGQTMIECIFYDITQRHMEEEKNRKIATKDHLTGLLNRRGGEIQIDSIISTCDSEHFIAVYLMDLDGFKQINDTCGHDAGDKILVAISERLQTVGRATDIIVRWGGDEFVLVLFGNIDKTTCFSFGEKIIQVLTKPIDLEKGEFATVGASIGVSLMSGQTANKEILVRSADKAMYEIKNKGKNGICYCQAGSDEYDARFF